MRALTAFCVALLPFLGSLDADALPDVTLASDAPGIARAGGVLRYRGEPFSGYLVEKAGATLLSRTPYLRGRQHGVAEAWYPSGRLRYQRPYRLGHREGTHRGYWDNGQVQYVQHYEHDLFEGEQVAFYANGVQSELRHYHDGSEEGAQRFWDGEGRLVANYTFKHGRRYGIVGRFDCTSTVRD